jgi:hypothetical protein
VVALVGERSTSVRACGWWAVSFFCLYAYSFPYFDRLRSAQELPRLFTATEIVDRGTLTIDHRLRDLGSRFDVAVPPDGHAYSNKAPGLSFAAVPVYLLVKSACALARVEPTLAQITWAFRICVVTLPTVLFLPWLYTFSLRFTDDLAARRMGLVAYGAGSMAMPYSMLFFSHQLTSVLLAFSFICAVQLTGERSVRTARVVLTGVLLGAAVVSDYPAAIGAAVIGSYVAVCSTRRLVDVSRLLVGAAPLFLLLGWYHASCFGSPLTTGYSYSPDPYQREGFLGLIGPNAAAFQQALFSPRSGLLLLSPWVMFAAVGAIAIGRNKRLRERCGHEALASLLIAVSYILYLGSVSPRVGHGGWSVGPRYITVALPFLAWLATAGFAAAQHRALWRIAARASIWLSVVVYVVASATYPHWPLEFSNPLYEVSLRAIREGLSPHSLGTLIGLPGAFAYLPLFAAAALLTALAIGGQDWRSYGETIVAGALAFAVFWSYGYFPGGGARAEASWQWIRSTWEPMR